MKQNIFTALLLGCTALALIGHGIGGTPPKCWFDDESMKRFNFVGSCAPPGVITLQSDAYSCSAELSGETGYLPTYVSSFDSNSGAFTAEGELTDEYGIYCSAVEIENSWKLHVLCTAIPKVEGPGNESIPYCEGTLSEVADNCDIRDCPTVSCAEDEHLTMDDQCCAACLTQEELDELDSESDTDSDNGYVEPGTLPEICDLSDCIDSCPDGYDLVNTAEDDCCPVCVAVTEECIAGREIMWQTVTDRLVDVRDCETDADCSIFAVGSRCGLSCPYVMAISAYLSLYEELQPIGDEECAECRDATFMQTNCDAVDARPFCDDGTCDLTPYDSQ